LFSLSLFVVFLFVIVRRAAKQIERMRQFVREKETALASFDKSVFKEDRFRKKKNSFVFFKGIFLFKGKK